MTNDRKRSAIWMCFIQLSGQFNAKCDTCSYVYSMYNRWLTLHIREKHPSLAESLPLHNSKSHGKISRPLKRYKLITILTVLDFYADG